jgi:hypothetical protein
MNTECTNNIFDKEINTFTDSINNTTIDNTVNIKHMVHNTIFSYMNHIEKLKKLIEIIDNKLDKDCNHEWKRDFTYYGEHSQYQCSICKLYK